MLLSRNPAAARLPGSRMPVQGLGRSVLRVRCLAVKDPNAPEQANKTGALSSMSNTVMEVPRSENVRKYWRTVYDFPNWQKHRKQTRLVTRLFQIPQSHILQNTLPAVGWVTAVAVTVATYMYAYDQNMLPPAFPSFSPNASCQAFVNNTSVALSLLLVFRTNSAYGRWDEARKMWGGLLNRSRDIMRQSATCFPDEYSESKKALARWTVAFARALRIHFQPEVTLEDQLKDILRPEELAYLAAAQHKPVRAIHAISQIIQAVPMSSVHQMQMSNNLTFMHDVLGGCERLLRAPIPVSYTRHTSRFLFVWLTILPFALYGQTGWAVIPVCAGIAAVLCGIEEIGVQCEEPFGILPLDVICNRIQADVMATHKDDEETKAILAPIWRADFPHLLASGSPTSLGYAPNGGKGRNTTGLKLSSSLPSKGTGYGTYTPLSAATTIMQDSPAPTRTPAAPPVVTVVTAPAPSSPLPRMMDAIKAPARSSSSSSSSADAANGNGAAAAAAAATATSDVRGDVNVKAPAGVWPPPAPYYTAKAEGVAPHMMAEEDVNAAAAGAKADELVWIWPARPVSMTAEEAAAKAALQASGTRPVSYASTVNAPPADPSVSQEETMKREVMAQFDRFNLALQTLDARRVVALYSPRAVYQPALSNVVRATPDAIEDYFRYFLTLRPTGCIETCEVRLLGEDTAINSGVLNFELLREGAWVNVKCRFSFTYIKDEATGEWAILDHHSSGMPEPVPLGSGQRKTATVGAFV